MSEKVKLTREQAEAIETALNEDGTEPFQLVRDHILSSGFMKSEGHLRLIGTLGIDILIRALYNGYEVEMSKEERVAEYITRLRNTRDHSFTPANQPRELNIEISGALQVLEYLDIKIDGVNT